MSKSSKYWDKRALKRLMDAEKTSDIYINRIKRMYNQAYRNINKEIASVYRNYAKDTSLDIQKLKELLTKKETDKMWKTLERQGLTKYVKDNYKSRISRLEQIQAQIYGKAKLIYPKEELEQTMCYKGVINDSYYKAIYDTQMGTGFDFSFNKIDNNMTQALLNEKWSGKNYSQRIWENTDILAESLSQVVGGALLSGQSIQKTSRQIRERFNVSKHYAERLVRTETNHFNNTADAMAYEEMGIDKYVFVATLDSRTSIMCQEMDGQVFNYKDKVEGDNFPPLHPNCRSKTRGYLGEDAEKLLKRRARNPITGKTEIIDNMSYNEWNNKNVPTVVNGSASSKIVSKLKPYAEKVDSVWDTEKDIFVFKRSAKFWEDYKKTNQKMLEVFDSEVNKINFYSKDIERSVKNIDNRDLNYKLGLIDLDEIARKEGLDISYSPYSSSTYALPKGEKITWGYKPLGSYRVSDHWNFESRGEKHCRLSNTDEYIEKTYLTKYNGETYDIIYEYEGYYWELLTGRKM